MFMIKIIFTFFLCTLFSCTHPKTPIDDPLVETPAEFYAIDSLEKGQLPIDVEQIAKIESYFRFHVFGLIDSFIVIHKDKLCYEKYFNGYNRHIRHKVNSVSKSIISAIVGILVEDGVISLDDRLIEIYSENYPGENVINYNIFKEMITLRSLLKMSSGLQWKEITVPYFKRDGSLNANNSLVAMYLSDDHISHIINLPIVEIPGTKFNYSSGDAVLTEFILERKTGLSLSEIGKKYLFDDIGINSFSWSRVGTDNPTNTDTGLYMHPIDIAQFGYLFLRGGYLNGKNIISNDWIKQSTSKKIDVSLPLVDTTIDGYGYYWWHLNDNEVENYLIKNDLMISWGFGGQIIAISPSLETVIVSTARNCDGFSHTIRLFREIIIPLLQSMEK